MSVPRSFLVFIAPLVIFGGLGMGALLALVAHPVRSAPSSAIASRSTPRALVAKPTPTIAPTALVALAPTAAPTLAPTDAPTASPTASALVAGSPLSGSWRIDEANDQVGTIVWVGSAIERGRELIFDLHKESVAGRAAVPCERRTNLHIVLTRDEGAQSVPFQEVNCEGTGSDGVVRVSVIPGNGAFGGSFWQGSTKLGDFTARRQ